MARSETKPAQVKDAIPYVGGTFEKKGTTCRGRTEIKSDGTK